MFDGKAFGAEIVEMVAAYVARSLRPVVERLAEVEERQPEKGDPGADGVGLAGAVINRDGELMVTLSNGKQLTLGRVDGRDGMGFDDLTVEHDGERTVTFRFAQGERVKAFPVVFPIVLDRGVYRPEQTYEKGDAVSFGGSLFIAQDATSSKPESGSEWRLAVKRGRDGREKVNGSAAHA
jgi:hypothetical protein